VSARIQIADTDARWLSPFNFRYAKTLRAPRGGVNTGEFLRASLDFKNLLKSKTPRLLQAALKAHGFGGAAIGGGRAKPCPGGASPRAQRGEGVQPPADWGQQDRVSDRYHPACGGTCFVVVFHRSLMQTRSENQRSIAFNAFRRSETRMDKRSTRLTITFMGLTITFMGLTITLL
jgi:hypothetical protein